MSVYPYVVLLEILDENKLLVYSGHKKRNYLIKVEEELAEYYREKLTGLNLGEEILLEFDEEREVIRTM